jgi:hypothetical protein
VRPAEGRRPSKRYFRTVAVKVGWARSNTQWARGGQVAAVGTDLPFRVGAEILLGKGEVRFSEKKRAIGERGVLVCGSFYHYEPPRGPYMYTG